MIKVEYCNSAEFIGWYINSLLPIVTSKINNLEKPRDNSLQEVYDFFKNLQKSVIIDILTIERNQLEKTYNWIKEYLKLCDFVSKYSIFAHKIRKQFSKHKDMREKYRQYREEYLKFYDGFYLNELAITSGDAVSWLKLDEKIRQAKILLEKINGFIGEVFDYEMLPSKIKYEYVKRTGIKVCPYCNQQYIYTVDATTNKYYLGDIDHLLPKAYYTLFSISLWNLMPCCKPCNQLLKNSNTIDLLYPTIGGFDEDCILKVDYRNLAAMLGMNQNFDVCWELVPFTSQRKECLIKNNIDTFKLNAIYANYKDVFQDVLKKRYLISGIYEKALEKMLGETVISNKLIYGVSLDKNLYKEELLSKAINDIIQFN